MTKKSDAAKLLGSLGGKSTLEKKGVEHYQKLGEDTAKILKKKYGKEHFAALSKKAAEARTKKAQERKAKEKKQL